MEIGFFGFIIIIILMLWFKKPIASIKNEVDEGIAMHILESDAARRIEDMKHRVGCNDPNVKTAMQLLEWTRHNRS